MFEYLPLIAFQLAFAAAGLTILYRIVRGKPLSEHIEGLTHTRRDLFGKSDRAGVRRRSAPVA